MPRCTSRWPWRKSKSRYLPRRRMSTHLLAPQASRKVPRHRPAQVRHCAPPTPRIAPADDVRQQASPGGLDFGQLRHGRLGRNTASGFYGIVPVLQRDGLKLYSGVASRLESFYDRSVGAANMAPAGRTRHGGQRTGGARCWRRRWRWALVGPRRRTTSRRGERARPTRTTARRHADAMFEFLVAEIAAQRGDTEGALAIYHRLAARAEGSADRAPRGGDRDPRARLRPRAGKRHAPARARSRFHARARDHRRAARQRGRHRRRRERRSPASSTRTANRGPLLMQLSHLFAQFPDKAAVLEATRADRPRRYPDMPEARYAVGVAALVADKLELAGDGGRCGPRDAARLGAGRDPQGAGAAQDRARRRDRASTSNVRRRASRLARGAHAARARARRASASSPRRASSSARPRSSRRTIRRPPTPSGCSRCSSRTTPRRRSRSRARSKHGYREPDRDLPRPGPGGRGPQELRRGDRLVPEGRGRRLGARAAEDRDAHRAPAGPRGGPRIPAAASSRARPTTACR